MTAGTVIVGAGETGTRAALALRRNGYDAPVALIGAEPAPPYERPPVSKAVLADDSDVPPVIASAEDFARQDIDFTPERQAVGIDRDAREVHLEDSRTLAYDKLLLATGARARPLSIEGTGACVLLRTRKDALALREVLEPSIKLVIIGGGFIGLEVASSALSRGAQVTVIEKAPQLMGRAVPASIAQIMQRRHEEAGVQILLDQNQSDVAELREADVVVAGIGAIPEIELAEAAGLEIDNGIKVDGGLRTSDPHIYAAGDCCSFPHPLYGNARIRLESWRNALNQAEHVAASMTGEDEAYGVVPWFWSDQHDVSLQIAGLPQFATQTVVRELGEDGLVEFGLDVDGRLVSASGVAAGNKIAREIRAAELMIGGRLRPEPAKLGDANVSLKSLLRR